MRIKALLHTKARGLLSRVNSKASYKNDEKYFALNSLDQKIEKYLPQRNLTFIELGANDGISQSNTLYFEITKGWTGVLIEPSPYNFKKLINNRSEKNIYSNSACVGFDYQNDSVELIYSNLMTAPFVGTSDLVDPLAHAKSGEKFWGGKSYLFKAPARTLSSILDENEFVREVDLLSLDVEGGEIEVLRGIDHTKYRFRFILVESRDFPRIKNFLESQNYRYIESMSDHDYLFENVSN
jgi:FkbM family methyltransferase